MTDYVLSALTKRRAELATEAQAADKELRRILSDIEHIEGAIRTYDPTYRPRKVVLSRADSMVLLRTALTVLREASRPMETREIAIAVLTRNGRPVTDRKLMADTMARMRATLLRQRNAGVVRSVQGLGAALVWEVAR